MMKMTKNPRGNLGEEPTSELIFPRKYLLIYCTYSEERRVCIQIDSSNILYYVPNTILVGC